LQFVKGFKAEHRKHMKGWKKNSIEGFLEGRAKYMEN